VVEARGLRLFEATGVELEYMIVRREDLSVLPVADRLLAAAAGRVTDDVEHPDVTWSNELVLHVVELKTTDPAPSLDGCAAAFQRHVARIEELLAPEGGQLLPTAMHPLMDPATETRLWPHGSREIYAAFDQVFDCRGHGWSNLDSVHVNLPFQGDEEFGRLHAAIRLVLPLLPAIAASSPIVEGRVTGALDNRLLFYRTNCARIPGVTGRVVPEPVFTRADYQARILEPMYRDIAPFDPGGLLQEEWLNARGAIARFDRDAIEIRVIDSQECPAADLAVVALARGAVRLLAGEAFAPFSAQAEVPVDPLAAILERTIVDADRALLSEREVLRQLGWKGTIPATAGEVWRHLADAAVARDAHAFGGTGRDVRTLLEGGPLARRILAALGASSDRETIVRVYRRLAGCLARGESFRA